jgi:undecaprenyl-diphosphatase
MSLIQIIILSFVQGLTEFLPVSSSGHLLILPHLFGWQDQGLEMDVAVHIGTLAAVLCYFWRDIGAMITSFWRYLLSGLQGHYFDQHVRLSLIIAGATIPAVIAGFFLKKVGVDLVRHVAIVGFTSIGFGILLYVADRAELRHASMEKMTYGRGFMVGLAQALALIPGTSRSGACLTAGRWLGFDRVTAARFAFLLSIPSILGAGVLTTMDAIKQDLPILTVDVFLAIFFSMIFGLMAIRFMLNYLARHSLTPFVIYRIILGILILALV